ncbi:MAG: hypothetical protein ACR2PZ_20610 [Pseudomonadales bacterium]
MRVSLLILVSLFLSIAAKAAVPIWFVSVYGESMQLISGAAGAAEVTDGVFLGTDFVGTEIYVRVQEGYELDGFRPYESASNDDMAASVSESALDSSAQAVAPEEQSMDEFGPLSDTGLQYYVNDDYFGWICSEMYVQPMGDRVYRLRCEDSMEHTQ